MRLPTADLTKFFSFKTFLPNHTKRCHLCLSKPHLFYYAVHLFLSFSAHLFAMIFFFFAYEKLFITAASKLLCFTTNFCLFYLVHFFFLLNLLVFCFFFFALQFVIVLIIHIFITLLAYTYTSMCMYACRNICLMVFVCFCRFGVNTTLIIPVILKLMS